MHYFPFYNNISVFVVCMSNHIPQNALSLPLPTKLSVEHCIFTLYCFTVTFRISFVIWPFCFEPFCFGLVLGATVLGFSSGAKLLGRPFFRNGSSFSSISSSDSSTIRYDTCKEHSPKIYTYYTALNILVTSFCENT